MPKNLMRIAFLAAVALMTLALGAAAQTKKAAPPAVADGQYNIRATYKLADQPKPIVDFGGKAEVRFKKDVITIVIPIFDEPVVLKRANGVFRGQLRSAIATVEFQCEIVEANHTEGVFTGTLGGKKVFGIWTMELVNAPAQAPEIKGT